MASVFEFCVCLSVFLSDCSLLVSKLARDPEYPQRIRVASVFIYKIIAVMFFFSSSSSFIVSGYTSVVGCD